jgi:HK97 family phage prohead protease
MSIEEIFSRTFGSAARREQPSMNEIRRIAFVPEVRATSQEKRQITFVASTEKTDRYGDVIRVGGWDTKSYMQNPVVLWSHQSSQPPIGKTVSLSIETNPHPALVQCVEFATKQMNPLADQIYNLYSNGFLKSVSVGFKPTAPPTPIIDPDGDFTGYEFNGQELLELSCCAIPANPDAMARAVSEGIVTKDDAPKFFKESKPAVVLGDLGLELDLALLKISNEKLRMALLERECLDLQARLKQGTEVATLEELFAASDKPILTMDDLDRALKGE